MYCTQFFIAISISAFFFAQQCVGSIEQSKEVHVIYFPSYRELYQDYADTICSLINARYSAISEHQSWDVTKPEKDLEYDQALYTQESVLNVTARLCNQQKDSTKMNSVLVPLGFSNGAGTLVNALRSLVEFNPNYFAKLNSDLVDQSTAYQLINYINTGIIVLDAPLLHIKRFWAVDMWSNGLSYITGALVTGIGAYVGLSASIGTALCAGVVGSLILKKPAKPLFNFLVPRFAKYVLRASMLQHFDFSHPSPLDSAKYLKDTITCPILIHFKEEDGILTPPDAEAAEFCDAIGNGNVIVAISKNQPHIDSGNIIPLLNMIIENKNNKTPLSTIELANQMKSFVEIKQPNTKIYTPAAMKKVYPRRWFS